MKPLTVNSKVWFGADRFRRALNIALPAQSGINSEIIISRRGNRRPKLNDAPVAGNVINQMSIKQIEAKRRGRASKPRLGETEGIILVIAGLTKFKVEIQDLSAAAA